MSRRFSGEDRALLDSARVGCLSTVDQHGVPHLVPFCFARVGDCLYSSVDEKPQSSEAQRLGRVQNVRATGRATALVHHYEEDWSRLGWLQVRADARVLSAGEAGHGPAVKALREKYAQYRDQDLNCRPILALTPREVVRWGDPAAIRDETGAG